MSRSHSATEYADALKATGGLVAPAARRLGVSRAAVYAALRKYPTVQAALDAARDDLLDLCEGNIFKAVSEGDLRWSGWLLERLGRERGYVTRHEVEQPYPTARELEQMSDEELAQRARELGIK